MELTHFNEAGRARMVDVSEKAATDRAATAAGFIHHAAGDPQPSSRRGGMKKGDVLAVAQIAGIQAAKHTASIIPMCHPLLLTGIDLAFSDAPDGIAIEARVRCHGETGVEMEALTAVSAAALTIYDMCKAVQRDMEIKNICLLEKSGGKNSSFSRQATKGAAYEADENC